MVVSVVPGAVTYSNSPGSLFTPCIYIIIFVQKDRAWMTVNGVDADCEQGQPGCDILPNVQDRKKTREWSVLTNCRKQLALCPQFHIHLQIYNFEFDTDDILYYCITVGGVPFFFLLSHIKNISSHSTPGRSVIRRNPHLTATTLLMIDWKDIKRSRKVAEGQRSDGIILSSSAVPLDSVGHRRPGEWTFLITAVLTFPLSWLTFSQLVVSKTSSEVWY